MFCGANLIDSDDGFGFIGGNCPNCGKWILHADESRRLSKMQIKMIGSYLIYHKQDASWWFIGSKSEYEDYLGCSFYGKQTRHLSLKEMGYWYPISFESKIDTILLYLAEKNPCLGVHITLKNGLEPLFFIDFEKSLKEQLGFYFHFLESEGYIKDFAYVQGTIIKRLDSMEESDWYWQRSPSPCEIRFILTPKAWGRIYELQKSQVNNKNVFVSMAFRDETNETRDAIKQGIINAGFSVELMDEIIHNRQIVPEMLRLIRESRFLIMDITDPNFGAYYEAGYAEGLGKQVIITCKEDIHKKKDFSCPKTETSCYNYEKSVKPHFDIAQKQMLIWKDGADLTKKLEEWIRFLFPDS